jgi:hypothetical protein
MSDSELGQASYRMNVQAAHDAFAVGFNRADTDAQLAGNFFIALTFGNENEDFALTIGELAEGFFLTAARHDLIQRGPGDIGAEKWLALVNRLDGLEQLLGRRFLGDITMSTGLYDAENVFAIVMDSQHQDLDARTFFAQHLGHRQAVHPGHVDVHQNDVGRKFPRFDQRFIPILGLAYQFEPVLFGQARLQSFSNDRVIIRH